MVAIAALWSAAATVPIVGGFKQHSRSRAPGTVLSLAMTVRFGLITMRRPSPVVLNRLGSGGSDQRRRFFPIAGGNGADLRIAVTM